MDKPETKELLAGAKISSSRGVVYLKITFNFVELVFV